MTPDAASDEAAAAAAAAAAAEATPRRSSRQRRRTLLRRVAVVLLLLVVAWSAAWFYVPPLVQKQAAAAAERELGRALTIGRTTFNPWTLELTLTDIALAAAPGAAAGAPPLLQVKRIRADPALSSLFRLAPVIDALDIDAPALTVARRADGSHDIDDVLARIAARPASPEPAEPARFAVYNIVVRGGSVDVADAQKSTLHRVRDLELGVPFLSSFAAERTVQVEPRLAFVLDGTRFDSAAEATPFAERGDGRATLKLERFDLAPWLVYLPATLPVRPRTGSLTADLQLAFEQRPRLSLRLSGTVSVEKLKVADARDGRLADVGAIRVEIDELRPLEQKAVLRRIEIEAPNVLAARDARGRVNLMLAAETGRGVAVPVAPVPLPTPAASVPGPASAATSVSAAAVGSAPSPSSPSRASAAASRASSPAGGASAGGGWTLALAELSVRAGRLDWQDATTQPPAALSAHDFSFDAQAIGWPLDAPVVFKGQGRVVQGDGRDAGRFVFDGQGHAPAARLTLGLEGVPLEAAAPYLRPWLEPALAGRLDADVDLDFQAGPPPARAPRWKATARRLLLSQVALGPPRSPEFAAESIEIGDLAIDGSARRAQVGRLALKTPRLVLQRGSDRKWNVAGWTAGAPASASPAASVPAGASMPAATPAASAPTPASGSAARSTSTSTSTSTSAPPATAASAPAWSFALRRLEIGRGATSFVDASTATPVALEVSDLQLQVDDYALDAAAPAALRLSARVVAPSSAAAAAVEPAASGAAPTPAARSTPPTAGAATSAGRRVGSVAGSLDVRGTLQGLAGGVPAKASLAVLAKDLPLHAFDPWFDGLLNVEVQRALVAWKGDVVWERRPRGALVAARGDLGIDDFRAASETTGQAMPQRALTLRREGAGSGGGGGAGRQLLNWKSLALRGVELDLAPDAPLRLAVAESALSDFFARIVLDETGRLNLQDVVRSGDAPAAMPASTSASAAVAVAASGVAASSPPPPNPPAQIRFGPITVAGGRVNFNDRFVKPNYTANLSELSGRLAGFSSQPPAPGAPPELAELALTGRVEGTATLEVAGRVNPLARPLALDLKAQVRDLELPSLSPYSVKYAGYGIERGKLSVDLGYKVEPDGRLAASNRIVLNQLAFGDKVEGAPASLPVKLAVALLADRRGVIDLDLPVSGSINDPQFSVGGLVWQAIKNLVVKAITSPFSLLASAFGGGTESSDAVDFAPGTAELGPKAREALDKVAVALAERPGLSLTVTGESRLEGERDAWKQERLRQVVRGEKRRQAIAAGAPATVEVTVAPAEYPALLKQVYERAELANKPKNPLGLAKEQTTAEMESLLLAGIVVADDAMQQLALRRGVAVRDYLAAKSLPTSRLFLGAPRTSSSDENWTPRAVLRLQAT